MTLVRIVKDWDYPNLLRQSPNYSGLWDDIQFTLEPVDSCDYLVAFNRLPENITVNCPPEHIWVLIQEPPVQEYHWHRMGFANFHQVLTQDTTLVGAKYVHSQPSTPWHVDKDYDFLNTCPPPDKPKSLSTITSMATGRAGHRRRLNFLLNLRERVDFDWVTTSDYFRNASQDDMATIQREKEAQGLTFIYGGKWEAHTPYQYSLVFENHSAPYYWTEKLMDCFLSWTMPIYYGCTTIDDYFPAEAIIKIDIEKPAEARAIIEEAITSDLWIKRRDAIAHARELCLEKYQCFPFLTKKIRDFEAQNPDYPAREITLPKLDNLYKRYNAPKPSLAQWAIARAKRTLKRLLP